jgi:hypothetical protein
MFLIPHIIFGLLQGKNILLVHNLVLLYIFDIIIRGYFKIFATSCGELYILSTLRIFIYLQHINLIFLSIICDSG